MGLGMFDTSDNSLMVYIFGAEKSRPFTQSLHCFVGVGFVIGSALASPFLPEKPDSNQDSVCAQEEALVAGGQQSELIEEEEVKIAFFLSLVVGQLKLSSSQKSFCFKIQGQQRTASILFSATSRLS